jgi:hypothetical protein
MANFILVYRTPKGYTPGAADVMREWQAYFEKMGSQLVDVGNPVFDRNTLGACDGSTDLGGYSLVTAEDREGALSLAKECPILKVGGGVEVGELTLLNPSSVVSTDNDHARASGVVG